MVVPANTIIATHAEGVSNSVDACAENRDCEEGIEDKVYVLTEAGDPLSFPALHWLRSAWGWIAKSHQSFWWIVVMYYWQASAFSTRERFANKLVL
jgi:hypothetical protein